MPIRGPNLFVKRLFFSPRAAAHINIREDLKGLGELTVERSAGTLARTQAPANAANQTADRSVRAPQKTSDLALAARWGYVGQGGVTMPGPGKVTDGTRGDGYLDIHLNTTTRWKDVPEPVWRCTLGGYQVLKKWLSYSESALLGRPLTSDEAQQFTHHVRRIAAILGMSGELDGQYRVSV